MNINTQDPTIIVKKIYICYMQLKDILVQMEKRLNIGLKQESGYWWDSSESYAKSFNSILKITQECFQIDKEFSESISDIEKVEEAQGSIIFEDILSRGSKLRGTLEAFIRFHMTPENKEKIGFMQPYDTNQ